MPGVAAFPVGDITFLSLLFNFYGYYLPIFLYAAWTPLALYELSDNRLSSNLSKFIWTLVILLVPTIGCRNLSHFFCRTNSCHSKSHNDFWWNINGHNCLNISRPFIIN